MGGAENIVLKISIKKVIKYLFVSLLVSLVLVLVVSALTLKVLFLTNNNLRETTNGKVKPGGNSVVEKDYFRTKPVFSQDGNILVFLEGGKFRKDGGWGVRLRVSPWNNNWRIEDTSYVEGTTWLTDNKDVAFEHQNFFKATWTNDGNKLAVFLPHKVVIKNFEKQNEKFDDGFGNFFVSTVLREKTLDEVILNGQFDTNFAPDAFYFSKSGEELFFAKDAKLFQVWPEKRLVYAIPSEQGDIYPLPGSNGFGYFSPSEPYGSYDLIIVRNSQESTYKTPIKGMDYAGDIIFSPDSTHLCAGLGASGHYGYTIFEVGATEEIVNGQQYSYCVKWLDNYRVLVKNIPYFYQWSTQYYIVDVRTSDIQFVDNIDGQPEDWEGLY